MAPEPMTARLFGSLFGTSASLYEIIRSPSIGAKGNELGRAPVARMIWDAGGEYVYHGHMTNRSTPVSREDAFMLASEADIWLDTGNIATMKELMRSCPGFSSVKCVRDGMVYNNDARTSPGGGNEYWETSPARPDLVLGDLISILHPDRLTDGDSLYYYRRIE